MKTVIWAVAAASLLLALSLQAQNERRSKLTEVDRAFLEKAAQANLAEIEAGQLAKWLHR